jgi:CubicO group peptidase (beta-lactamase class C family)
MEALAQLRRWPCANAAVAVVSGQGTVACAGDLDRAYDWASVTKLATAVCALVAVEQQLVGLDDPVGPPGSTLRHLLAHTSGLPFEGKVPLGRPGARRVYSNSGFELVAEHVAAAAGVGFGEYFEAVWGFPLAGSPAAGVNASLAVLSEVARELLAPSRLSAGMLACARSVQFAGLGGVLPGFGRYDPNDWGLGFELRDAKSPHWTGASNSPACFGHFGRSGTFLWVEPRLEVALACLTDLPFGEWAKRAWPALSDAVCAELAPLPETSGDGPPGPRRAAT